MASTVSVLSLGVIVVTLTVAIAPLPACAEEIPSNTETTSRTETEKFIVKNTVTPSKYNESYKATYTRYTVGIRNATPINLPYDEAETVTAETTSTAAQCSFEETMALDLGALLDAGEGALVTLVAGKARLTAHRAVLAARSPAFAAMLCHASQDANNGHVAVLDVEGPVLRQILAYLYTLQAPQLPGMAPQLLAAGDKFGLSTLKADCEMQVAAQLAVETAAATAVLAIRHSSTSLRQAAIAFIKAHTFQVMATQGWADAARYQPEYMTEVYRLLSEPPVKASPQIASLGSTPAAADSQPTTVAQSSQGQTPATSASPAPPCMMPPPGDDAVSPLRSLSTEEKRQRLRAAAKEGRVREVEALLAVGADVGMREKYVMTALHWAAARGHVEVARLLLGCGAQVDARDYEQGTPLHSAAFWGYTAVARLLLAASADPNARDESGKTPLHLAAYWGKAETAAALLELGADSGARDKYGRTPLDDAWSKNWQQVTAVLNEAGKQKTSTH